MIASYSLALVAKLTTNTPKPEGWRTFPFVLVEAVRNQCSVGQLLSERSQMKRHVRAFVHPPQNDGKRLV